MAITFGESGSYYNGPSSYNQTFYNAPNIGLGGVDLRTFGPPGIDPNTTRNVSQSQDAARMQLAQQQAAALALQQQQKQQQQAYDNWRRQMEENYRRQLEEARLGKPGAGNQSDQYADRYDKQNAGANKPPAPAKKSGWLWDMFGMLGAGSLAQSQAWMGNTYGESPWNPLIKQDTLAMLNQKYPSAGAGFNKETAFGGKPEYLQALRDQHTEKYINSLLTPPKPDNGGNGNGNGYPYPPWQFPQIIYGGGGGSYTDVMRNMYNALMNWQVGER